MKKFISILLCIIFAISALSLGLTAQAKTFTEGDYKYTVLSDGTAEITKYSGNGKNVTIPSTLGGHKVKIIGISAFYMRRKLTAVKIPNSIIEIKDYAFQCSGVAEIEIGKRIRKIGYEAFDRCAYWNNENNWENGLLYISKYLIDSKKDISGDIKIKSGTKLIAKWALKNCHEIKNIYIPKSVKYMNYRPFEDNISLENIFVNNKNKYYSDIDGVLFNKKQTVLINYPQGKTAEKYIIPKTVIKVSDFAMMYAKCHNIIIGKKVKTIGKQSFYGFDGNSVVIPKSVESIGENAFGPAPLDENGEYPVFILKGFKNSAAQKYCDERNYDTFFEVEFQAVNLNSPRKSTISAGKEKITINYKKVKKAEGFQVKYTKGKKSYTKSFKTKKSVTKTINNLQKGKYQVKIRAFYIVDGVKIYSKWTKTKTVKVN